MLRCHTSVEYVISIMVIDMKGTIKAVLAIRALVFIVLLSFVAVSSYSTLSWKDTQGISGLNRSKAEVGPDVVFLGTSHSFCSIITAQLWEEYGIAAEDYSESGQTFISTKYYLIEALKTCRPKVIFVELKGLNFALGFTNGVLYRNTINMQWSKNYVQNMNFAVGNVRKHLTAETDLREVSRDIILKFPVVHTRYRELREDDFSDAVPELRHRYNWSSEAFPVPEMCEEEEVAKLDLEELAALDEMAALAGEYGFDLVLWVAPYIGTRAEMKKYNAVEEYARENGIKFYNFFDLREKTGFDFSTDMCMEEPKGSHLNSFGAQKMTAYIGRMLNEDYDLPDRHADPAYSRYDEVLREWNVIRAAHILDTAESLEEYLFGIDPQLIDVTTIVLNSDSALGMEGLSAFDIEESDVSGLFTNIARNPVNGIWELSDRVKLSIEDDNIGQCILYDGTETVEIGECDLCIVAVSKINGKLINKTEFILSDCGYMKK